MNVPERVLRLAAPLLGICSVLLMLAAGNLLFAAWLFFVRDQRFWASFWAGGVVIGLIMLAEGVAALAWLTLSRREGAR